MPGLYDDSAWIYDAAFDWNLEDEADWLVERFGPDARRVLEPACGSGRIFPELVRRGLSVTGIDISPRMLDRARGRMTRLGLPLPRLVEADVSDFDLGETFDAAVCPINSFLHLTTDAQARGHLECMARHLAPGSRYLLMVDLCSRTEARNPTPDCGRWEVDDPRGGARIECRWTGGEADWTTRLETQVSTFTIRGGPEDGREWRFEHIVRAWDWESWRELVHRSPLEQIAAHDGSAAGPPPVLPAGPGLEGRELIWHELRRP